MIDATPLLALGLLLVRPGMLILSAPPLGGAHVPAPVKIGITVLLAIGLLPATTVPVPGSAIGLGGIMAREAAIGLALGMSIRAVVAAAELAGQLVGFQMGLSYSAIVDPQSGVRNNILSALYGNLAMVIFLLMNGHHVFLRALRDSYETLPIGAGHIDGALPQAVIGLLAIVFTVGARLAAPVLVVLVVTELALALVARSAPALNLMVVGAPVRLLIGLVLLGLTAPAAVGVLSSASRGVLEAGIHTARAFR